MQIFQRDEVIFKIHLVMNKSFGEKGRFTYGLPQLYAGTTARQNASTSFNRYLEELYSA